MRVLRNIAPSSEQLKVINDYTPGFALIRGAAGSGKTTTAILRLRLVTGVWKRQRQREGTGREVRVLVLTYNRTLRGYIEELAFEQASHFRGVHIDVTTFGRWSYTLLREPLLLNDNARKAMIRRLGADLGLEPAFVLDEVEYVLGRFRSLELDAYLTARRDGRGLSPRMEQPLRQRLLDEVVRPYLAWKSESAQYDWNDLALELADRRLEDPYDIVIVDEAQDFSANQIRGVVNQLSNPHPTTFILDAVQRIYPRGFSSWREVGVEIPARNIFPLPGNFRNTREIARFARGLVEGLELSDDGSLPDFEGCTRGGQLPVVATGRYERQMDFLVARIQEIVEGESIAILHPKGGGYFAYTKTRLRDAGIDFVELTRQSDWPQGDENVALITLHSAKGLEFDHVFIVGLNADLMPHGPEENDAQLDNHRRLVAMGIGRARKSVTVTYKREEASSIVEFFGLGAFDAVEL